MDYKKKYLKYKFKYLQAKQNFKGGAEEEAAAEEEELHITAHTDDETRTVSCRPSDAVHDALAAAFERPVEHIEEALLGNDAVQPGETFDDLGIEDGARLNVRFWEGVHDVVAEIATLNPGVTRERLMEGVIVDPKDPSRVLGNLNWQGGENEDYEEWKEELEWLEGLERLERQEAIRHVARITNLPESIGALTVTGDLNLHYNNLATLPASFGSLTVGGHLRLSYNNLQKLPDRFRKINVGRYVWLDGQFNKNLNVKASEYTNFGLIT